MKITVEDGEIILSDVYSGVGIRTDRGLFGIAQRDGGITVRLDGVDMWDSEHPETKAQDLVSYLDSCKYVSINDPEVREKIYRLATIAARGSIQAASKDST